MQALDYQPARPGSADRTLKRLKRTLLLVAAVALLWLGAAVGRVAIAHAVLLHRIDHGTASADGGDPRSLNRNLHWWASVRPLLLRPWRGVVLYYPNGYGSADGVKVP